MKYVALIVGAVGIIYLLSLQKLSFLGAECIVISSGSNGPECLNPTVYTAGLVVSGIIALAGMLFIAKGVLASQAK